MLLETEKFVQKYNLQLGKRKAFFFQSHIELLQNSYSEQELLRKRQAKWKKE